MFLYLQKTVNLITVKLYRANAGDAFLLSFGNEQNVNIMVDMGYVSTYNSYIERDLLNLNKENRCLDLLIITHIDRDHIRGALAFFKKNGLISNIIKVNEVWHNSYRHLQFAKEKKDTALTKDEIQVLKDIVNQNKIDTEEDSISNISAKEGTSLASLLYKYEYKWNDSFGGKAVTAISEVLVSDLVFTIISPTKSKLESLENYWKKELYSIFHGITLNDENIFDDAYEFYMQNINSSEISISDASSKMKKQYSEDDIINLASVKENISDTPTNGASIAFIIEYLDKRLLFLGDAHEDVIYENLLDLKRNGDNLKFDVVKVSHHGSINNSSKRLFDLIIADNYIISTDGKRSGHPSHNVLSMIISKKSENIKHIYTNYDIESINIFNDPELKRKFMYDIVVTDKILID